MDESKPDLKPGDSLPEEDSVYRRVLITERDRKNKKIPSVGCFSLKPADNMKLSVDWNKMTTPEQAIARIGSEFRFGKSEFKNWRDWELYGMEVEFLLNLPPVSSVFYDPIVNSIHKEGQPNNPAHSLVVFQDNPIEDEPEIILMIRDHAKDRSVPYEKEIVRRLVEEYNAKSGIDPAETAF
jgi:hypothetical protein